VEQDGWTSQKELGINRCAGGCDGLDFCCQPSETKFITPLFTGPNGETENRQVAVTTNCSCLPTDLLQIAKDARQQGLAAPTKTETVEVEDAEEVEDEKRSAEAFVEEVETITEEEIVDAVITEVESDGEVKDGEVEQDVVEVMEDVLSSGGLNTGELGPDGSEVSIGKEVNEVIADVEEIVEESG